jgi:hypothetical protein
VGATAVSQPLDRVDARWHFLEVIRADLWFPEEREAAGIAPELMMRLREVVDDLAGRPLELYREARERQYMEKMSWQELQDRSAEGDLGALREMIGSWSKRWWLDADWARTAALGALDVWCSSPERLQKRLWRAVSARAGISQVYRYQRNGWYGVGSFSAYKRAAVRNLVAQVEKDLRDEESALSKNGRLPPEPGARAEQTYLRAARIQVLGDAISSVADEEGVGQKSVTEAVSSLLRFLDLPERPRPLGRPTGSEDTMRARRP